MTNETRQQFQDIMAANPKVSQGVGMAFWYCLGIGFAIGGLAGCGIGFGLAAWLVK